MKKLFVILLCGLIAFIFIETNAQENKNFKMTDKSIIYFGDPITEGGTNNGISWTNYINDILKFKKSVNASKGGATFSQENLENMIVTQVLEHKDEKYDYILLQGGINDAKIPVALGEFTDSYQLQDFDLSTYTGMLDATFYYLTKYYKGSSIGVMIMYPTPYADEYGWTGKTGEPEEYFDALIKICEKWGIPYIDFYDKDLATVITKNELLDGVHLTDQGYQKISPYLANFIQTLQPYNRDIHKEEKVRSSGLKYYNEKF